MKKYLGLFFALVCAIAGAQTFPVQNLQVNGSANFNGAATAQSLAASSATISGALTVTGTLTSPYLSAATGSPLIGYSQGGSGALLRTSQAKFGERISLLDYATGNGSTNDGAALRAVNTQYPANGGALYIPFGTYVVDAASGSSIAITKPISIYGDGGIYTSINPSLASSSDNNIVVNPSTSYDFTLMRMQGFYLGNPTNGTRGGNNGIELVTLNANQNLPQFTLRDCIEGQSSTTNSRGFYHVNSTANNPGGGMYAGLFENCNIKGGMRFEGSGDSISAVHNVLSGTGMGLWVSLTPGSSLFEAQANNITTSQGAIHVEAGPRVRIVGNNIEHSATGAVANNDSSIIDLIYSSGVGYGGVVMQNLISGFGSSDATRGLNIAATRGLLVQDNVFLNGASVSTGIAIAASAQDTRIGPNTYDAGVTTKVSDSGVGTMGVQKDATLLNSWAPFNSGGYGFHYIKTIDGIMHVNGIIKSGTTTNGTNVASISDTHFCPAQALSFPIMYLNVSVFTIAEMTVDTSCNFAINGVATSTKVSFDFSYPTANLADAVSAE